MEENTLTPPPVVPEPEIQAAVPPKTSSPGMLYGLLAVLAVVVLTVGGLLIFSWRNTASVGHITEPVTSVQPQSEVTVATPSPIPEVSPVTTSNAQTTLDDTDAAVQGTMTQVNNDLNDLNKVNSGLDTTTGL
jgi:hypothetical protein